MNKLNLPPYDFTIRTTGQSTEIFDSLRKKFVILTPEEWVRQHFAMYLKQEYSYPANFMAIERGFRVNNLPRRADIVVYDPAGKPWLIVECKAPSITLNEDSFYQAAAYHLELNVQYLIVTNGMQHYCCKFADGSFRFQKGFPSYSF